MADMTNVDSEKIGSTISQLDESVSNISTCVAKFKEAIAVLDKGWTSSVKSDFMTRYQKDEEAMQEMLGQYREINTQLRDTASDFEKTESEILSGASALK